MFLLFLLQAAAPPAPHAPLPGIYDAREYPPEAIAHHWEGAVTVDVVVDAGGNPTSCVVIKSSGHKVLDDATCNAMLTRAKFSPAAGETGKGVPSIYHAKPVQWRLDR